MNASRAQGELEHVLCVEDDPHLRQLLQLALETVGGMQVTLCARGEEALAALRESTPDLLLLDVHLPGLSGPAILAAVQAEPSTETPPVIYMTGTLDDDQLAQLRGPGVLEVISKPFEPLALADRLRAIWRRSR
jgi:two-component system, OmpR family, response regulator